jgi:hydrogenase large subunit
MLAILGGKAPHNHGIFVGGITVNIDVNKIVELNFILSSIKDFVDNIMLEDIDIISKYYSEDFKNGKGYGNFLSYGAFDESFNSPMIYVKKGTLINNVRENLDISEINEDIIYSYYLDSKNILTKDDNNWQVDTSKKDAYSWWSYMKSVRDRNIGWRIDCFIISDILKNNLIDAYIYSDVYGSDHCPIGIDIKE